MTDGAQEGRKRENSTREDGTREDGTRDDGAQAAARLLAAVRARKPLIHHITNFVTMNAVANVTLAAGALPVMAHAREEVEEMASAADALVLNLGTLWPEQVEAMLRAGNRANRKRIPVVLDPVGAGATTLRSASAQRLMHQLSIGIVRGNAAEMAVLAGGEAKIRGVESVAGSADASAAALAVARHFECVAVVTGAVDTITDGRRVLRVANGHPTMTGVTGTGCMATAVIACFAAVEKDLALASAAALAVYGLAGEQAAQTAQGPGSFAVALLDAMANLTEDSVRAGVRMEESTNGG